MSGQAKSQVQVTISGKVGPEFNSAFQSADKRMQTLGKTATDLNNKLANIGAYRRQQNALKDAATEYTKARQKVADLKKEIEASGTASRKQASDLARAEKAAARAAGVYSQARTKLSDMGRELQKSGVNVNKLSKEYRSLQKEVVTTNTKMQQQEKSLLRQQKIVNGMQKAWSGIGKTIAGTAAAGAVLSGPTGKAINYDEMIARLAATAGAGKSQDEKTKLKTDLSNMVENARKFSGGSSRDDIASALNTLVASGQFSNAELGPMLNSVSRTAFAAGGSPEDIAKLGIAFKQFGITDIAGAFDRSLKAGQVGRFELRDMAKSLPDQLARAKAAGYTGMGGLSEILSLNQVAMNTAGGADQAGNNVVNLLAKMNSRELSDSIGKAVKPMRGDPVIRGKKGKGTFNWGAYVEQNRGKGINAVESFAMLLERQLSKNKDYQKLKKQAAGLPEGADRRATLEAMANIAQGTELGKVMADLQATSAMLARLQGGQQLKDVQTAIGQSSGAVNQDAQFLGDQTFAKKNLAAGSLDRANETVFNQLATPINKVLDGMTGMAEQYPKLTAAGYAAAAALTAVAAWGAGSGLMDILKGKGAGGVAGEIMKDGAQTASKGGGIWGKLFGGAIAGVSAPTAVAVGSTLALSGDTRQLTPAEQSKRDADNAQKKALFDKYGQSTVMGALYGKNPWWKPNQDVPVAQWQEKIDAFIAEQRSSGSEASQAAQAASDAAKAAQNRPNVYMNSVTNLTVNSQAGDAKTLAPELQAELDRINKKREAEARSSFFSMPGY